MANIGVLFPLFDLSSCCDIQKGVYQNQFDIQKFSIVSVNILSVKLLLVSSR